MENTRGETREGVERCSQPPGAQAVAIQVTPAVVPDMVSRDRSFLPCPAEMHAIMKDNKMVDFPRP